MASSRSLDTVPRWLRALQFALGAVLVAYTVWTVPGVRPQPGFDVAFDGVLQGSGYVLVAVLAVIVAILRRQSLTWWLVAGAVALRAVGFAIALTYLSIQDKPLPVPSPADAAWVLSTLVLIGAVVVRIAEHHRRLGLLVALDGVAATFAVIAFAIVVLADPFKAYRRFPVPRSQVLFNIGYPVLDTVLLVAVATLITSARLAMTLADVLLVLGAIAFSIVDYVFAVLFTEGRWHPGSLLASFSLLATAGIASAAAFGVRRHEPAATIGRPVRSSTEANVAVPAIIAILALVGLVEAGIADASDYAFPVYGVAIAFAVLRGVLTLVGDRREAGVVIDAAQSDLRRFYALVEASTDFIGIADPAANVLYLNPAGRRMMKLAPDQDVTGFTVGQLLANQGADAPENRWPMLLDRGSWEGQSTIVPTDGSDAIPVAISSFAVRDPDTHEPIAIATIQRDIRERLRAEAAVRELADQRAALLTRLVEAQEDERARIAADVHDDPVQALAAVDLRLGVLRRRLVEQAPALVETLDVTYEAVTAATDRLRNLLFDLEPPALGTTLGDSLAGVGDFVYAGTDVHCAVTGDRDLVLPPGELSTAYRIAKEAMVNVRKHADARRVVVDVARVGGGVRVTVSDDGAGIDSTEALRGRPGHRGLSSMRDRAQIAGGALEVLPGESGGTQVRLWLPLPPGEDDGGDAG